MMQNNLPLKMLFSLFPLGALAAVVVWFVYVIQYANDGNTKKGAEDQTNTERADIAFQAVVASVLVYFVLHHHLKFLM